MRGKSMILIIIALGCGLVASIGISQIMDQGNTPQAPEVATEKIFVTLVPVDINETITPQMVKLEEWPKDRIPEGAITTLTDLEGLAPNQRLFPGEVVMKAKLIDPNSDTGVSRTIPTGFRVMAVKMSLDTGVAGLIQPGDHVDVLVYLRKSGGVDLTGTITILKDVRIFAVDSRTGRDTDAEGNAVAVKTVSVLVKPKQVEMLLLASRLGQISLSLRPPDDNVVESEDDDTTNVSELLSGSASIGTQEKPAPNQVEKPDPNKSDFLQALIAQGKNSGAPVIEPQVALFKMEILGPESSTTFEFSDDKSLPQEVGQAGSTGSRFGSSFPVNNPTGASFSPLSGGSNGGADPDHTTNDDQVEEDKPSVDDDAPFKDYSEDDYDNSYQD